MTFTAFSLLAGISLFAAFTSCKKSENGTQILSQSDRKNVFYGNDTAQNMDIYLPAGRDTAKTNVLLFIHGGSWNNGDKNEFNDAIAAVRVKLQNYAIFNINYRLAKNDSTRFPVQMNDIESALNFIESRANEYNVNVSKVGLIGASAGAHLALLEAYKNNRNGKIKAVIDLFGPSDLTDLYNNHPIPAQARPVLVNFLGATPATNPEIYYQASPINFVNAQSVPTKIFRGTDDVVVPIAQSNALAAKLLANNVQVDTTIYKGEGHGWQGNNLLDTYQKTIDFIIKNVR